MNRRRFLASVAAVAASPSVASPAFRRSYEKLTADVYFIFERNAWRSVSIGQAAKWNIDNLARSYWYFRPSEGGCQSFWFGAPKGMPSERVELYIGAILPFADNFRHF